MNLVAHPPCRTLQHLIKCNTAPKKMSMKARIRLKRLTLDMYGKVSYFKSPDTININTKIAGEINTRIAGEINTRIAGKNKKDDEDMYRNDKDVKSLGHR